MDLEKTVRENLAFLDSVRSGDIRSFPEERIEVDAGGRRGVYLVTDILYDGHGRMAGVKAGPGGTGLYEVPEVTYMESGVSGTVGLGAVPERGELPLEYRDRLEQLREDGELFDGPAEAVEVLERTYRGAKSDFWEENRMEL